MTKIAITVIYKTYIKIISLTRDCRFKYPAGSVLKCSNEMKNRVIASTFSLGVTQDKSTKRGKKCACSFLEKRFYAHSVCAECRYTRNHGEIALIRFIYTAVLGYLLDIDPPLSDQIFAPSSPSLVIPFQPFAAVSLLIPRDRQPRKTASISRLSRLRNLRNPGKNAYVSSLDLDSSAPLPSFFIFSALSSVFIRLTAEEEEEGEGNAWKEP